METRNDYSATFQLSAVFTIRVTVQLGQWTNCPEEQNKALMLNHDSFNPLQNIQKTFRYGYISFTVTSF